MKKNYYLAAMAMLALWGCSQNEVTDVPESRQIKFDPFVGNNTRAVTPVTTDDLTKFYVFGTATNDDGSSYSMNFNNEVQSTAYYWQTGYKYNFAAYANGDDGKIDNATCKNDGTALTFAGYTPDDTKDLVAAFGTADASVSISTDPVALTFAHLLSQVKFTFSTTDGGSYRLGITNLEIKDAVHEADGVYTYGQSENTLAWTENSSIGNYEYNSITEIANGTPKNDVKLVIPQGGTNDLQVSFTATMTGADLPAGGKTHDFTLNLPYTAGSASGTTSNTWTAGYIYNYKTTINLDNIDSESKPITFTPTVTEWSDADDSDITPVNS